MMHCSSYLDAFLVWLFVLFFFNDTATTEIYTLSLHDALPISCWSVRSGRWHVLGGRCARAPPVRDRKSGSAGMPRPISYAVFCLKKNRKTATRAPAGPPDPHARRAGCPPAPPRLAPWTRHVQEGAGSHSTTRRWARVVFFF